MGLNNIEYDILEIFTNCIKDIQGFPEVAKIVLFGSYAKNAQNPDSDLDIAVFIHNHILCDLALYKKITKVCINSKVDIQVQVLSISELDCPQGIVEEVVEHGIEIFYDNCYHSVKSK